MNKMFQCDVRLLGEEELVYRIANNKTLKFDDESTFDDIISQLTPSRKQTALAVVELYTRLKTKNNSNRIIRSSEDIYNLMYPLLVNVQVEEFWAIFLNSASRIIKKKRIAIGGISSTIADVRIVLKEALLCNAVAIAIVHNHPSGSIRPSKNDDVLTDSFTKACDTMNIRLIDHVIVTDANHYSYANEGRI